MANSEAESWKEKGNASIKEKNFDEAIKHYNKAIALDGENATYYSNRAAAWSNKGVHASALADAEKAIAKDPNFVKAYSRKGKALFDLGRVDEAETAYKDGLKVDAANAGCQQGVQDVLASRRRKKAAASSSGGMGGMGNLGGFAGKLMEKMKGGGRMQKYMLIMGGYYIVTQLMGGRGGTTKSKSGSSSVAPMDDDDENAPPYYRTFAEVDGMWVSYLQQDRRADTTVVMIHRTALAAESEWGQVLHQFKDSKLASADWLDSLLAARPSPKRLVIGAVGKDAAGIALGLARRRPETAQLILADPDAGADAPGALRTGADLGAWVSSGPRKAQDAQAAADAGRWAAATSATAAAGEARPLSAKGLPKDCGISLVRDDNAAEDDELRLAFEAQGLKVTDVAAAGKSIVEALIGEAKKVLGPAEEPPAAEEEEEASEPVSDDDEEQ